MRRSWLTGLSADERQAIAPSGSRRVGGETVGPGDWNQAEDAGPGDDDVEAAELADRAVDGGVELGGVLGVSVDHQAPPADRLGLVLDRIQLLRFRRVAPGDGPDLLARSKRATCVPSWAKASAWARPCPCAAPVMNTT